MSEREERMCYAASFPGMPGYGAISVDDPKRAKRIAKTIAEWIKRGATVSRVETKVAVDGLSEYLRAKKTSSADAAERETT